MYDNLLMSVFIDGNVRVSIYGYGWMLDMT